MFAYLITSFVIIFNLIQFLRVWVLVYSGTTVVITVFVLSLVVFRRLFGAKKVEIGKLVYWRLIMDHFI